MAFELPVLPYADDALEPYYTAHTFSFHYGKHHKAYVDNLNKLTAGTDLEGKSLEDVIRVSAADSSKAGVFNNSAQVWNHTFFWRSMKPGGGGKPMGDVLAKLEAAFGTYESFVEQFKTAAVGRFGSGWCWLVLENGALKIVSTPNADTPLVHGQKPLFTVDVWEHAYYLDYQNKRADYVQAFFDHLINWDFVKENL
jgi:Fe-Mn family superoxide dismutase